MTAVPASELATPTTRAATATPDWVPTNALVAFYLAATVPPLAAAVAAGRAGVTRLVAHLAFLALTAWGARYRPTTARDSASLRMGAALAMWAPLLLIPPLYTELPQVAAGLGGRMHDAVVIGWERTLFGDSPARMLAGRLPWRWLSELLHAGYLSYYALIIGPPALFFATGRRRAFAASAFTVMLAFVCCYAVFVLFPVQGPWFEWAAPAGLPRGPVRHAVERLLLAGSSRGTAFPSSHVAVSVAQTLVTLRLRRPVGVACAVCTATLALGAVYGGLHYGIDVVVGAAIGTVVGTLGPRWLARRLPAPTP